MTNKTFETTHLVLATVGLVGLVLGCASTVPGSSGETHFLGCHTTADCIKLGSDYGCVAGVCRGGADADVSTSIPADTACSGVDVSSDSSNCGACGSVCAATTLATAPATYSPYPSTVAVDARGVYWAVEGATATDAGGSLLKVPLDGGTAEALAIDLGWPFFITQDTANIYGEAGDATVHVPKLSTGTGVLDGQMLTPSKLYLASGQIGVGASDVAVDAANVYYSDPGTGDTHATDGTVWKISRADGTQAPLVPNQDALSIAVDATGVYWTNWDGTVKKVSLQGGEPVTLASGPGQNSRSDIAVDATSVYCTSGGTNGGGADLVMKVPLRGGKPVTLASNQRAWAIAVDATSVYWTNVDGTVMKIPLGGGSPVTLVTEPATTPTRALGAIAVDATSVYWTEKSLTENRLMKAPLDGFRCERGVCN